ncbi:hypothetical protein TNCV_377241 [Trichonephila clavipes]|nr:hypothetical protein TNCV_377241 [Trichonephila clavipes]
MEITLIESRFHTVEEVEPRCSQGIRLFNSNNSINEYNNKILNAYADGITATATAKDVYKVNGDRYRAMITNFFIPELNNPDVQELWFQQDGATCHTARATIDLLKDTFGERLISRFGPVNWPPRSCHLTPLDYFLWAM